MNNLKVYKCGNTYKYVSIPVINNISCLDIEKSKQLVSSLCKLDNNIIRAKTKIKDLILCNNFLYFVTITFNSGYDRFNLKDLQKKLCQRIRDYRKKSHDELIYILIPEQHKNGAWHFHGVLGRDFQNFITFNKFNHLTCEIFDKFGFVNISLIEDNQKVSSYITKYITKDMTKREKGKHLYFCSNNLCRPVLVNNYFYNNLRFDMLFFEYHNDFCFIRYDNELKNLNFLK